MGRPKWITLIMVMLMVVASLLGVYAINQEINRDELTTVWSYSVSDHCEYDYLFRGEDGTIYARETNGSKPDGIHYFYLLALTDKGEPKWRYGMNADWIWPTPGPDGGLYYVDSMDAYRWTENNSRMANFTALSPDGGLKWRHTEDLGTLTLEDVYQDGSVLLHHYYEFFNQLEDEWQVVTDRILTFSPQGELVGQFDLLNKYYTYSKAKFAANGTVEVFYSDYYQGYQVGVSSNGSIAYQIDGPSYFYRFFNIWAGHNDTAIFYVLYDPVDLNTTFSTAYAVNMSEGKVLWKTLLYTGDNPYHNLPGEWSAWDALVDEGNIVYCLDGYDHMYALDGNGDILWNKSIPGYPCAVFEHGVLTCDDDGWIKRIDDQGNLVWGCRGGRSFLYGNIGTTPEGNIIVSNDEAVMELTPALDTHWNDAATKYLFLTAAVMLGLLALMFYFIRHEEE